MWKNLAPAEKILLATGHAFFWALIGCCILFFRERLLAFDTAYYTFHIIAYEEFFIKHNRYISYLTQWVPLVAIQAGGSLANALKAFSASFYVWFYLLFILISYGFRNVAGGTFLVFALCLGMRYKFYAAISEITFAIVIASVLLAWLAHRAPLYRLRPLDFLVVSLCLVGLFGAHAVLIYPIMTFLVFERLYNGRWKALRAWVMPAFILAVLALKFLLVQGDSYESGKMSVLFDRELWRDLWIHPDDYFIFTALEAYFLSEYLPVTVLFLGTLGWLFFRKKVGAGAFILLAAIGWTVINILTYSYLRGRVYIILDGYLAVFGMIWATPFYFFLRENRRPGWAWVAVALIGFSTYRMVEKLHFFHQRHEYIRATLKMYPDHPKLLVPNSLFEWETMWYPYEIPHESLMLTALDDSEACRTIYVNTDTPADSEYLRSNGFLQFNGSIGVSGVNRSPFFQLPDGPYYTVDHVAWK